MDHSMEAEAPEGASLAMGQVPVVLAVPMGQLVPTMPLVPSAKDSRSSLPLVVSTARTHCRQLPPSCPNALVPPAASTSCYTMHWRQRSRWGTCRIAVLLNTLMSTRTDSVVCMAIDLCMLCAVDVCLGRNDEAVNVG